MKLPFSIGIVISGGITALFYGIGALSFGMGTVISFVDMLYGGGDPKDFFTFLAAFCGSATLSVLTLLRVGDLTKSTSKTALQALPINSNRSEAKLVAQAKRLFSMSVWQVGAIASVILFSVGLIWSSR